VVYGALNRRTDYILGSLHICVFLSTVQCIFSKQKWASLIVCTCRAGGQQEVFCFVAQDGTYIGHCGRQDCCTGVDSSRSSTARLGQPWHTDDDGEKVRRTQWHTEDPRSELLSVNRLPLYELNANVTKYWSVCEVLLVALTWIVSSLLPAVYQLFACNLSSCICLK